MKLLNKPALLLLAFLTMATGAAVAEPINIDISTPVTVVIKHSMTQRISRLVRFYDAGLLGLDKNGMIAKHDTGKNLTRVQQQNAEKLIDQENNDREAMVHAIAYSHEGQQARVPEIRAALLKRYREQFKSGWWMQDDAGNWFQKP